ncbi:MAG: hypothetical protein IJF07_09010 [Lachnospiraceae bacterium]|nr:hypothetical protein [Lachnospiraceae bacterium]
MEKYQFIITEIKDNEVYIKINNTAITDGYANLWNQINTITNSLGMTKAWFSDSLCYIAMGKNISFYIKCDKGKDAYGRIMEKGKSS